MRMTALLAKPAERRPTLREAIERTVIELQSRQILTEMTPEEELAAIGAELSARPRARSCRNAGELPARIEGGRRFLLGGRRVLRPGRFQRQPAGASMPLLFGDCDIQMEADFLRREAGARGIDLHVAATFPDDVGVCGRAQARRDLYRRACGHGT